MGRCKPLGSLISFLSYAPQLSGAKYCFLFFTLKSGIGCFLHSPSSSAITMGGGSICWITVLGAFIHIWRPATDGGCDISCLLIWQEIFSLQGQEATIRTGHGAMDQFQIGKGVCQGCILSPCLFNLYAEYIMRNTRLDETQAGIKIARRNTNNL